ISYYIFGITVLVGQVVFGGLRWLEVQKAIKAPLNFLTTLRLFYVGIFFNQVLLSGVGGDIIRSYLAYKEGVGIRPSINGVILERLSAVIGSVLIIIIIMPIQIYYNVIELPLWFILLTLVTSLLIALIFVTLLVLDMIP